MNIAYKVVKKTNVKEEKCKYISTNSRLGDLIITYEVGKIIKPKIGKIFVFGDFPSKSEISYLESLSNIEVFKCIVDTLIPASNRVNFNKSRVMLNTSEYYNETDEIYYSKIIKLFWNNEFDDFYKKHLQTNFFMGPTFFCNEIVLFEKVTHLIDYSDK